MNSPTQAGMARPPSDRRLRWVGVPWFAGDVPNGYGNFAQDPRCSPSYGDGPPIMRETMTPTMCSPSLGVVKGKQYGI